MTKKIVLLSIGVTLASLLVTGCMSPFNTASPSPSPAQHSALLEKLVPIYQQQVKNIV